MAKRKKMNLGKELGSVALVAAGSVAGSQVSGIIERQNLLGGMTPYSPFLTAALGVAAAAFLPDKIKPIGLGMAGQGVAEGLEMMLMGGAPAATTAQGARRLLTNPVAAVKMGNVIPMGFTPQPNLAPINTPYGIPVR